MQSAKKLYALHSIEASDMGDTFATVIDRTCLRDYDENEKEKEKESTEIPPASIFSCGNCGIFRVADIDEIEKRMEKSEKFGTCYSLIKPVEEWTNPLCMEKMTGECENDVSNTIYTGGTVKTVCIRTEHHKPMTFDTDCGEKEGLTLLSTLLCTRGGVIKITRSGQHEGKIFVGDINVKEKILELIEKENDLQLVSEYLDRIKTENPDYVQFLELLAARESTGRYDATNGQYLGRYQIGNDVFMDIGFKDKETGQWTNLATSLGVDDKDSYLQNQVAQEVAILFALRMDYFYVSYHGDDTHIGDYADGVKVTESGLIAAAHLVGHNSLHKAFTQEKSWDSTRDGNNVKASTYMEEMGGLDLSGILGGIN